MSPPGLVRTTCSGHAWMHPIQFALKHADMPVCVCVCVCVRVCVCVYEGVMGGNLAASPTSY